MFIVAERRIQHRGCGVSRRAAKRNSGTFACRVSASRKYDSVSPFFRQCAPEQLIPDPLHRGMYRNAIPCGVVIVLSKERRRAIRIQHIAKPQRVFRKVPVGISFHARNHRRPHSLFDCHGPSPSSPSTRRLPDFILERKLFEEFMAVLIEAINVKRRTLLEFENTPFYCLEAEVNTPTARGGQTLVRLKIRNLLTSAVFEKTFKASDKFKEPDLQLVPASYLYSDSEGSHFMDQESFDTLTLD